MASRILGTMEVRASLPSLSILLPSKSTIGEAGTLSAPGRGWFQLSIFDASSLLLPAVLISPKVGFSSPGSVIPAILGLILVDDSLLNDPVGDLAERGAAFGFFEGTLPVGAFLLPEVGDFFFNCLVISSDTLGLDIDAIGTHDEVL